ncbi:sigma-54-dependent Fis family transcriptional regulator [[Mycobacterium] nativiensis]|uniref:Helix-turn-helix domain-containing protein n=1 Tax=[Mycobacterium] nativiensis TaxID=2855503 RepID=A0ABU5Y383_9MYCO|nr:helix-turn-helix domain-containing protein [Mycolicibacter sp. MYC340]MEB3034653.1 helix-turn-helix domain-containing protein [Mycolicibacter sp. MYC340]
MVGQLLDEVQFAPGFDCSEAALGTNGIGTVLEAGQPLSVVGSEHFTENLRRFACTGAPIIDPVTRRIEGVLDITSLAQSWSPLIPTLIKNAAKDISRNLLLDRNQSQRAIFETYLRVAARSARHAVFAFGDTVFIASPCAQQMFDAGEQQVLREHATFLMTHKEHASDTIALPGRERLVHLWGTRIFAGSEIAGIVVTAELVSSRRSGLPDDFPGQASPQTGVATQQPAEIADAPFRSRGSLAGGRTPAWVRACGELRAALENKQPALLVGETGVGKSTLAIELFHSIYPNAHSIALDAAQIGIEVTPSDIGSLVSNRSEPTLHIVRDIDQASPDGVEKLEAYFSVVESLDGPAWIVATVSPSPPSSDSPCCALLSHFDTTITVPPLRCRTDDLPAITATLLHTIAPKHKIRVSPSAQRLISRYSWPSNISQLREALAHAVRRRPVGEIQDGDLPGYCQTGSRRALTPLEIMERDAIVAALQNVGHNRVAAATELGMSRSSLYRKLKTYGITA